METYEVQRLAIDEFTRGEFGGEAELAAVFRGTWEQCARYWSQYASGLQDAEAPASNQNFSRAYFWRIVEVDADDQGESEAGGIQGRAPKDDSSDQRTPPLCIQGRAAGGARCEAPERLR